MSDYTAEIRTIDFRDINLEHYRYTSVLAGHRKIILKTHLSRRTCQEGSCIKPTLDRHHRINLVLTMLNLDMCQQIGMADKSDLVHICFNITESEAPLSL